MLGFISALLWLPALLVRFIFIALGVFMVPVTGPNHPIWGNNEHPEAPKWFKPEWKDWLRNYVWRAFRNPANNLRYLFKEPKPDLFESSNGWDVDGAVRFDGYKYAWRWVRSGVLSEFWYLRRVGKKFFEFRIGWKFSGVPGFMVTIQLRLGG